MGRVSFGQYGNYTTPQGYTLTGKGSLPGIVLGQWWYDFSRIAEANISIFMGIEHRFVSDSGGSAPINPKYGLFIQPDGDIPVADLFIGGVNPDVQRLITPNVTAFHGYDAAASIANPGVPMQILFAVITTSPGTGGTTPNLFQWRSVLVDIVGV